MKPNLSIRIKGTCSESKNDIAKDLQGLFLRKGYGEVNVVGVDNDDIYDGLSSDETVEIRIK